MGIDSILGLIGAAIGSVAAWDGIKWVYNRKPSRSKAEAEAEKAEIAALRETIETLREAIKLKHENNEWLQGQLQAKEERFTEQTQRLRKYIDETISLTQQLAARDVELAKVRCNRTALFGNKECPFRIPPTALTPPQPEGTIEEYFDKENGEEGNGED